VQRKLLLAAAVAWKRYPSFAVATLLRYVVAAGAAVMGAAAPSLPPYAAAGRLQRRVHPHFDALLLLLLLLLRQP
jgi:hypothetical protein